MVFESGSDIFGIMLLALGLVFSYWFRQRKFDRTNNFGVQQFPSYWIKIKALAKDLFLKGLSIIFFCAGVLVLSFNHAYGWGMIIVLPVLAYIIFLLFGN